METARELSFGNGFDKRYAVANDLARIHSTWSSLEGVGDLPIFVRTWIPYLTVLLKFGFDGVKAPIGALTLAHWRANARANRSERSTFMALAWLEANGWITRRRLRLGENRFLAIIEINRGKFSFFLKLLDVTSEPTCMIPQDNHPPLQTMHSSDPMNTKIPSNNLNTTNATMAIGSKICAKPDKPATKTKEKTQHYQHPIRYTCFLLLAEATDRQSVLRRIDAEIAGKTQHTSFDAKWFSARWLTMSHTEREFFAAQNIIPAIRAELKNGSPNKTSVSKCNTTRIATQPKPEHLNSLSSDEQSELAKIQQFLLQAKENARIV